MTDESKKLFERFVDEYPDAKIKYAKRHIEFLIEDILRLERHHAEISARWPTGEEIMNKVKWRA